MGNESIAPPFLTSSLGGVSGQLHAQAALPPGEKAHGTHCISGWVGPESRSGRCSIEKNLMSLPGIEPWPSSL
jgi:hypothetical protein